MIVFTAICKYVYVHVNRFLYSRVLGYIWVHLCDAPAGVYVMHTGTYIFFTYLHAHMYLYLGACEKVHACKCMRGSTCACERACILNEELNKTALGLHDILCRLLLIVSH